MIIKRHSELQSEAGTPRSLRFGPPDEKWQKFLDNVEADMKFNDAEVAAILAGLRLVQMTRELPSQIADIYYDSGASQGLGDDEIDDLCERINRGG